MNKVLLSAVILGGIVVGLAIYWFYPQLSDRPNDSVFNISGDVLEIKGSSLKIMAPKESNIFRENKSFIFQITEVTRFSLMEVPEIINIEDETTSYIIGKEATVDDVQVGDSVFVKSSSDLRLILPFQKLKAELIQTSRIIKTKEE